MRAWIIGGALALAVGLVAAPLLAGRSASRTDGADGGATYDAGLPKLGPSERPPMQVREVKPRDGGPEVVYIGDKIGVGGGGSTKTPAASDAGPAPESSAAAANAELRAQIALLMARQARLQEQQANTQQQTELLQQMNDQLKQLNEQQAAAQQARADREAAAAAQEQQRQAAIQGLEPALEMLTSGNDQIGDILDAADQAFPPQARRDIAAARDAIGTSNLALARSLIQTAILDAQAGR